MVNKKFKFTRVLNILLQTTFYGLVLFILFLIFGGEKFTVEALVYALFPAFYTKWWFVTVYVLILFLSPALNILLNSIAKKPLAIYLSVMLGFTVLFPYLNKLLFGYFFEVPYLNEVIFSVELYLIGGYLRLYGFKLKKVWIVLITFAVLLFGAIVTYTDAAALGGWRELGGQMSSFTNVVVSVGLLLIFKDFKFKSRIINTLAATTFGIYLISENWYMRDWEYKFFSANLFPWVNSSMLMFLCLTVTIFIASMIIDFIRLQTIHRLSNKFLKFVDQKIANKKATKHDDNKDNPEPTNLDA